MKLFNEKVAWLSTFFWSNSKPIWQKGNASSTREMGGFFRVVINSKMLLILTYFSDFISCQNTFSSYFVKNNWAFFEFVTTLEPSKKEFLSLFFASSRSPETRAKSQTHLLCCKTEQHPFWGQHFQGLQKSHYSSSSSSVLFGLTAAMTLRPDNNLCCL